MFVLLYLLAQVTPVQPIVKGTALPLASAEERAVIAPVDAMFAALAARDGQAMLPLVMAQGGTTAAVERPDGTRAVRQQGWAEWAAGIKPGPERYEERLVNPAIEIDGDIAMVWGDYVFLIDGKLHHCGVDHFGLVREGGAWKVASLAWSQRTEGCVEK